MKVATTMGNCSVGNCICKRDNDFNSDFGSDAVAGAGDNADGEERAGVVVGVNFDSRSKELLTWALVKVAKSGDLVIALHVVDPKTEDKTALFSLVKAFDSVLAAYEGFCNLKQVDLKLKVSRGSPVGKGLAREAMCHGAKSLIVGTSRNKHHPMRSSVAVAKYCARNVGKCISVVAVNNGKILFQREAVRSIGCHLQDFDAEEYRTKMKETLTISPLSLESGTVFQEGSSSQLSSSCGDKLDDCNQEVPEAKARWALLRKFLLWNKKVSTQSSAKKSSVMHWISKFPSQKSFATISPVHEQNILDKIHSSGLEEKGATDGVPMSNSSASGLKIIPKELACLSEKYSSICRLFSYEDLLLATSNFRAENMIGKGGSSQVYKGILPDGKELAVKVLKPSEDVLKHFVSEIEIILSLNHPNIITLVGFCFEGNDLLLVYDLLFRGSLEDNLHGDRKISGSFGWEDRFKVALGVAEALEHLHCGATEPIIHRDVKSSNILLSDGFDPKLADFGLSVLSSSSSLPIQSTDVAGTFGYLAPEYFMHGKVIEKIDIYAYGVVLLELLSGRKPIDSGHPKGPESLVTWAKQILKGGKVSELLDPSLTNSYDCDHIEKMVLAATLCIRRDAQFRPNISIIVNLLKGESATFQRARQEINSIDEVDCLEGEQSSTNIQSFINLALHNLEDDALSCSSTEQTISVEDYLQGRWSRTSSFDQTLT